MLFLVGISVLGVLLLSYSSREIIKSAEQDLQHSSEMVSLKLDEYIAGLKEDIDYLAASPVLQSYLAGGSDKELQLLAGQYEALLMAKPDYSQVRYIGADGIEVARVDRRPGTGATIVSEQDLQDKSERPYLQATVQLPADSIYLSEINLNREYGKISNPPMPTVRAAMPVYLDTVLRGIIVINTDLSRLFASMSGMVKEDYQVRLVNPQGHYLLHEDAAKTFGFEYDRASTFEAEYGATLRMARAATGGVVSMEGSMYSNTVVQPQGAAEELLLLIVAEKEALLKPYYIWRRTGVLIIMGLGLLFLLTAFGILSRQTGELTQITKKLRLFPETLSVSNLPTNRRDEIGELAQGFEEMARILKSNVDNLETAKSTAEQAVKDKIEFIENISHEIRNPLQSIHGLSDLLAQNSPTPKQEHLINSLRFNTANLTTLVNDILDYRNVIEGKINIQNEWLPVASFVDLMHRSNTYQAVTKKIAFEQSVAAEAASLEVQTDRVRLSQIINNLLGNAIKYCREGDTVTLRCGQVQTGLLFEIVDTGPGMPAHIVQRINERYYTTASAADFVDSFGLGLTIVTELLSKMDSRLMVETAEGRGSSFSFVLTGDTRTVKAEVGSASPTKGTRLPGLSVLLIEDDPQIVQLYEHVIDSLGGSSSSVAKIAEIPTDLAGTELVISDYRLADGTLAEASELLLHIVGASTVLYIISADMEASGAGLPANRVLAKPVAVALLKQAILQDVGTARYGIPSFDNIKKDYDYQPVKYKKAISLLQSEWTILKGQLSKTIVTRDEKGYSDIVHKMITSVRRLELATFEQVLLQATLTPENSKELSDHIDAMMGHYLACIRSVLEAEGQS